MRNAYEILADFRKRAKRAGVSITKIDEVIKHAMQGDYKHLVKVIQGALNEIND